MKLMTLPPLGRMPQYAEDACVAMFRAQDDYEKAQQQWLLATEKHAGVRDRMPEYEAEALKATGAKTLKEARLKDDAYATQCATLDEAADVVRQTEVTLSIARHRLQTFTTLAERLGGKPEFQVVRREHEPIFGQEPRA